MEDFEPKRQLEPKGVRLDAVFPLFCWRLSAPLFPEELQLPN